MKSITFDEGYEEYMVNGDPEKVIKLRIADPNLLDRVKVAMEEIGKLGEKYKGADDLVNFDKEFRTIINKAFDTDICTPAFGDSNVMSVTSSGEFLFNVFFNSFFPQLEADIKEKVGKVNAGELRPEVKKYLDNTEKPANLPDVSGLTEEQKKALLAQLLS